MLPSRRQLFPLLSAPLLGQSRRRPRVAAIVTTYYWFSHADVILGRLMAGCSPNNRWHPNRCDVKTLYMHQVHERDMGADLAARHGFQIHSSIESAIGPDIDAVCFIGEHGNYPNNDVGQKQYPRYELYSQILDVYEKRGRALPTFFDKHLSYSWERAKQLYDRSAKLKVPWFAGSSIPLTIRAPHFAPKPGQRFESALALGYGDNDAYGFHTIESLQCVVENRAGGESGVSGVEFVEGPRVWELLDGEQKQLLDAALQVTPHNSGERTELVRKPVLFRIRYKDGLNAACLLLNGLISNWAFAGRVNGRIEAFKFGLPEKSRPLPHFDGLVHNIEELFLTGKPPYPVERTLLTSGTLAHLFDSKRQGKPLDTPGLAVRYAPPAAPFIQTA